MDTQQPKAPRKEKALIWIGIIIGVIVLCYVLVIGLAGLYDRMGLSYWLERDSSSTDEVETTRASTSTLTKVPFALVVKPVDPSSGDYPSFQSLLADWKGLTAPTVRTWDLQIRPDQPIMIYLGWCARSKTILDDNSKYITWQLSIDETDINLEELFVFNTITMGLVCHGYSGIIEEWSPVDHTIITSMIVSEVVHDGWSEYSVGSYIDEYNISVLP